jgi:hypothetical protein
VRAFAAVVSSMTDTLIYLVNPPRASTGLAANFQRTELDLRYERCLIPATH